MAPAPVDHEARRRQLTAVLLELVAEHGLEGASVRAVAARAGVSLGMVQHYFPSKDAMLRAAYRQVGDELVVRATTQAGRAPSGKAGVRAVLLELLPLDARRAAAVRINLAFAARALQAPELADELARDFNELHEGVARVFAGAGASEPGREAAMAVALVSGLGDALLLGDPRFGPGDAITAVDVHLDRALPARSSGAP